MRKEHISFLTHLFYGDGTAQILSYTNYSPFGLEMPNAHWQAESSYRFGYNGKEKDRDFQNNYDYGFRIYNANIAKFLSIDPLTKKYPELTPYQFASNRPIDGIDRDGLEYLRFDNVSKMSGLLQLYHNNGGLNFPVVEYGGQKYYNLGFHIKDDKGKNITEWVFTEIKPVVDEKDFSGYAGDNTGCYRYCIKTMDNAGFKATNVQYIIKTSDETISADNAEKALDLIHKSLEAGKPVIVGIDINEKIKKYNEGFTDHFVVIVSRGFDESTGTGYFGFYDVAFGDARRGTDIGELGNRFYEDKKTGWIKTITSLFQREKKFPIFEPTRVQGTENNNNEKEKKDED